VKLIVVVLLTVLAAGPALAQEQGTPHWMLGPDGQADQGACSTCHRETFELLQPKLDTCVMCHTSSPHVGASRHLEADATAVARLLPPEGKDSLPLSEDGRIYCGTCHLFHDPRVIGEPWLERTWLPASSGLPQAIRQALESRWKSLAEKQGEEGSGATFASKGTRALRLPVEDGTLCRHCHGKGK
jgi:hypothetical protein